MTAKFNKNNSGKSFINILLEEDVTGWETYKPSIIEFTVDIDNAILNGVLRASWLDENLHSYDRKKSFKTTMELASGTYTYKMLDINIMSYEGKATSLNCIYSQQGGWLGAPCSIIINGGDLGAYPSGVGFTLTSGTTYDMRISF